MINYVQRKTVDQTLVNEYLKLSEDRNHWTNAGPVKAVLEKYIEKLIHFPYDDKRVLCTSSGTSALHALMLYYENKAGRKLKWVTPAYTFPSCVVGGFDTRIVDIDPVTYTISPDDVGDADGIIITNLFGTIVHFDAYKFKDKIIIYDNASSFLSRWHTNDDSRSSICEYGIASFSSLHHTKTLGFGEGGFMVVDADMYEDMQAICGFGFKYDRIYNPNSSNFKMSDISAAYILQHMKNYDLRNHRAIMSKFIGKIKNINKSKHTKQVEVFNELDDWDVSIVYGNMPVLFEHPIDPSVFRDIGIEANKYYKPLKDLPNANHLYERIINFPLHNGLSDNDIDFMVSAIKKYSQ